MTESKAPIPKFASFRPKPVPAVSSGSKDEEEQKPKSKDNHDDRERERSRHHHRRHRSRSREPRKPRSKERHSGHVLKDWPERPPAPSEPAAPSDVYFVDKRGDEKNLGYGSIHRYDVPPFHRFGAGSVLGAAPDTKIDRATSDDKAIVLTNERERRLKAREKYVFSKIQQYRPQLVKIRPSFLAEEAPLHEADFIPLQTSRGKKRKRASGDDGDNSESDGDDTHYRSIQGKAKAPAQPTDDAFQYASDSDTSGSESGRALKIDASLNQKNIELSRKVEQSPNDIQAWLALIEHQDTLLTGGDENRRITSAETKSTADIKIHMYEKALEKAADLQDKEMLLLGLMYEGAKIWEIKDQSKRWEKISEENIDSIVLWRSYLDFKQSTFSTFRHEQIREVYLSRLHSLLRVIKTADGPQIEALYQQLIYVILRFTLYIQESGFTELAVAIWQGLLELNFLGPENVASQDGALNLFKDFWESEVPRIGEVNAQGWKYFAETGDDSTVPDGVTDAEETSLKENDVFKSWSIAERLRSKASRMPARTLDDTVEDDPYRVILYSDIESFLTLIPRNSEILRTSLLNAFLTFCRLPTIFSNKYEDALASSDPFISNEMLDNSTDWLQQNVLVRLAEDSAEGQITTPSSSLKTPFSSFISAPESFFTTTWFQTLPQWRSVYGSSESGPINYSWLRATLRLLSSVFPHDGFTEYYLAFEWVNEPSSIKKVAKTIIKQNPSSLRLYNAYAMIEWARGNKDVANATYAAALGMSKDNSSEAVILWKSWIWAYLDAKDPSAALRHLLSIPDGSLNLNIESSPATILRAQQHLSATLDYLLSGNASLAALHNELLALPHYLTSTSSTDPQGPGQGNITAALQTFTSFSSLLSFRNESQVQQLHLQSQSRLLHHHIQSGPYRPSTIHSALKSSLLLFPSNSIFFTLLTSYSPPALVSPLALSTLFSSLLSSNAQRGNKVALHIQIIHHHIKTGNLNAVHTAFLASLSSVPSSPTLQKLYILFLSFLPASKSTKTKSQLLPAVKNAVTKTPWCKEVLLSGIELLAEEKGVALEKEMRSLYKVMLEKELRVHVELEDVLEKIDERRMLRGE